MLAMCCGEESGEWRKIPIKFAKVWPITELFESEKVFVFGCLMGCCVVRWCMRCRSGVNLVAFVMCLSVSFSFSACKQKDADLQGASGVAKGSTSADRKFAWCRISPPAVSGVIEAIAAMEKNGRASVNIEGLRASNETALAPAAKELLKNPPSSNPPPCDSLQDAALVQSERRVVAALGNSTNEVAMALGASCEIENSSGVISITRLSSGNYRIEMLGCGGHQRSEMILNPKQLKSLGGILLRGV